MIVLTHSYKLSPFGPALQFVGGSKLISASSFWMRFAAELIPDLLIFSLSFSTTNFMKSLSLSASLSLLLSLFVDVCVSPFNFFELNTLLLAIRFFCSRSSLFYYTVSARTSPPSFVAKRDEVLTEKIVFEKFMPRIMKSSISGQNTLHLIDEERKKERRRRRRQSVSLYSRSLSLGSIS